MYYKKSISNMSWSEAFASVERSVTQGELRQQAIMIVGNSELTEYKNLSKEDQDLSHDLYCELIWRIIKWKKLLK